MKKILLVLSFTLFLTNTYAQTPKEHIETFFKTYEEESFDQAIDSLFATNKWFADIKDSQNNIKVQFSSFKKLVGDYNGYEPLTAQKVGTCYEYYTFLIKFDRQPIRFHFAFYKAKDKWILQNFKYEDQIASNLEQSALIDCIFDIKEK